MFSQRVLILCCFLAVAVVRVRVQGLAFDPALQRGHAARALDSHSSSAASSKCPFAAFRNTIGLKKEEHAQVLPPVQYNDDAQLSRSAVAMAKVGIVASVASHPDGAFTPLESWCIMNVDQLYGDALALKCPFFRRRAADVLDTTDMLMRYFIIRNTSLLGPPPSLQCSGKSCVKSFGNTVEETMEAIRKDWKVDTNKGYYVTGRLSTDIYRDDCLFDGPDPDMPVKGLRKYLSAASGLFCQKNSRTKLLSLQIEGDIIKAEWRFNGIMRLPWKPRMPEVTGTTIYTMDPTGLIYEHVETWDIPALEAFVRTFWPKLSNLALGGKDGMIA